MHHSRLFTDEQEVQIAKMYLEGKSERQLERDLKVSRDCIHGALCRQKVEFRSPAERNRLYQVNASAFDIIDSEHKAYFLGLIYADGSVTKRSLSFSQKRQDRVLVERLKVFLQSEHPLNDVMQKCEGKEYPQTRFYATERHLAGRLKTLGVLPKRPRHDLVTSAITPELERHFIRGYFDGDGCAHKRPRMGISFVGQLGLLEWIRNRFIYMGVSKKDAPITKHAKSDIYYLVYLSKKQGVPIAQEMYRDATTWLERKRERTESW